LETDQDRRGLVLGINQHGSGLFQAPVRSVIVETIWELFWESLNLEPDPQMFATLAESLLKKAIENSRQV
jgi:hypothetical protein